MHPFRDGAPFLYLIRRDIRVSVLITFLPIYTFFLFLSYTLPLLAVCGHHLSPRIAIVFSLLSDTKLLHITPAF